MQFIGMSIFIVMESLTAVRCRLLGN